MKLVFKSVNLLSLSFFFWGITGCTYLIDLGLASPQVVEINEIQNQDSTEIIKIEGTVERIIPLLDRRAIEIKDTTGSILVVTDNKILPKVGDRIAVEGILKTKEIIIDGETLNEYYLEKMEN